MKFSDAVESLRMYGNIPDVRNAVFDVWRTYDEGLVVSDVSFYLKLNHSRLVTSKLKWRPELREDISVINFPRLQFSVLLMEQKKIALFFGAL